MAGMACMLLVFGCFPVMSWLVRMDNGEGTSVLVWAAVAFQIVAFIGLDLSFGEHRPGTFFFSQV